MPVLDGWPSPRPPRGDRATEPGVQPDSSAACGSAQERASGPGRRPLPAGEANGARCLGHHGGNRRGATYTRSGSHLCNSSRPTVCFAGRGDCRRVLNRRQGPVPRCGPRAHEEFGRENRRSGADHCGVSNSAIRWHVQQRARPGYPAMGDHLVGARVGSVPDPYVLRCRPHLSNIRAYACPPRDCFRPSRSGAVDSASRLMKTDQAQDRRSRHCSPGRHRKRQVNVFQ